MIREERTALLLVLGCALAAVALYVTVLRPALTDVTAPSAKQIAAAAGATDAASRPAPKDPRPKSMRRMVSVVAWLRDAQIGAPLQNADVRVLDVTDISEPQIVVSGDGAVTIDYLPPDTTFGVRFEQDGYRPIERTGLRGDSSTILDLGLLALEPTRRLTGAVIGPDGKSLRGASVALHRQPDSASDPSARVAEALHSAPIASAVAGDAGSFEFSGLEPGRYLVHASAPGLASVANPDCDLSRSDGDARLKLLRGVRSVGRAATAEHSAGAGRIVVLPPLPSDSPLPASWPVTVAPIDAQGRFEIDALVPIEQLFFLASDGVATRGVGPAVFPADGSLELTFPPASSLSITVVDPAGSPVQNAAVRAASRTPGTRVVSAVSDARGVVRLMLDRGDAEVAIDAPGFAASQQSVVAPATELRVTLDPGQAIDGYAREAGGAPMIGAVLQVAPGGDRVLSDPLGAFHLEHVAANGAHLVASAAGYVTREIPLAPGGANLVEAVFEHGGEIVVHVRGKNALPRAGAHVIANRLEENGQLRPVASALTDERGNVTLAPLDPDATHVLIAHSSDEAPVRSQPLRLGKSGDPVALTLTPGGGVSGVAVGADGKPLAGVVVRVRPLATDPADTALIGFADALAVTAADGLFRLERLPAGEYRVIASDPRHVAAVTEPVVVREGRVVSGLSLSLGDGRVIAGQVLDSSGRPEAFAEVTLKSGVSGASIATLPRSLITDAAGRFRFPGVPPPPPPPPEPPASASSPASSPASQPGLDPASLPAETPPPPELVLVVRTTDQVSGAAIETEQPVDPLVGQQQIRVNRP